MPGENRFHMEGTAVEIDGQGVLFIGPSGSGKSDLAIRLIERGARLISDDLVELRQDGQSVAADFPVAAPAHLRGKIELRGVGIVSVPNTINQVPLCMVVRAAASGEIERLPEELTIQVGNVAIPIINLSLLEASAPAKVRLALKRNGGDIIAAP